MNQCDVVIVNFNAGGYLANAVESLLRSGAIAHIYIVDNASIDGSLDLLPKGHDDRLTTIHNAANLGFATACNLGLMRAASENLLVLNPDCRVLEGAIDHLITALRRGDRVGIVGPLLLNPDGSEQAGGRRKLPIPSLVLARAAAGILPLPFLPTFLQHHDPLPERPVEIEAISGACMMLRREMIEDMGPFDEGYFLHGEDLDLCMRARRKGWKVLFVPDARVIHHKGVSSRTRPLTVEYYKHSAMVRFYRKLLGETYPGWLLSLLTAGVWIRFAGIAALRLVSQAAERMRSIFRSGLEGDG